MLLNRRPFRNALPSGPSKSGDRNSTLPLPDEFAEVGLSFFDRHSECHALHVSLCTRIRLATRDTNATHHTLRQRKIRGSWKCCRQSRLADWCRLAPPLAQGTVLRIVGYEIWAHRARATGQSPRNCGVGGGASLRVIGHCSGVCPRAGISCQFHGLPRGTQIPKVLSSLIWITVAETSCF